MGSIYEFCKKLVVENVNELALGKKMLCEILLSVKCLQELKVAHSFFFLLSVSLTVPDVYVYSKKTYSLYMVFDSVGFIFGCGNVL